MTSFKDVWTIAFYTLKGILRSKILYNILFLGLGLLVVTYVAYQFTYGTPTRVALNFGLGTFSLSSVVISILFGVTLLSKEIEERTVYMIISRPISRSSFLLGKLLGLTLLQIINGVILSFLTLAIYLFIGGELYALIFWCILSIILESIIILFIVSFFSLMTTTTLSVIFTTVIYLAGNTLGVARETTFVKSNELVRTILNAYDFFLPAFYKTNIKDYVIYEQMLSTQTIISNILYLCLYGLAILIAQMIIFERKNLD